VTLQASIVSREALRYTPAGIAVLTFAVEHHSEQAEAGQTRDVSLTLDCVAVGNNAKSLSETSVGTALGLSGFLGNRSNKSRWVVFHVTEFELK
jgi:primosomal replication protein N